jgi:membrane protein implicated in regulation of membrane protease activity
MNFLDWQHLVFYIPLAVGVLMALGMALGVAEVPHGIDLDGDGHPDMWETDHDGGHHFSSPLFLLGFGRAPALLVFMTMALTFGGTGVIVNFLFQGFLERVGGFGIFITFPAASVVMATMTGMFARLVAHYMPTLETTSTTRSDLVGCTGVLTLPCDKAGGIAHVRKGGDLYLVACRASEPLDKGRHVLLTEYDEKNDVYDVCPDPTDGFESN